MNVSEIYQPSDDSYLLSDVLKKIIPKLLINNEDLKILEIGCGSGIQAKTLIDLKAKPNNITLTDINLQSINYISSKFSKSEVIRSNLFSNIKSKYDLIIFNPPYLPEDKNEPKDSKLATTGGKKGSEIINRFLRQSKKHLKDKDSRIILLTSSLTKDINWDNYKKKLLGKKKLFFEELMVWELTQT